MMATAVSSFATLRPRSMCDTAICETPARFARSPCDHPRMARLALTHAGNSCSMSGSSSRAGTEYLRHHSLTELACTPSIRATSFFGTPVRTSRSALPRTSGGYACGPDGPQYPPLPNVTICLQSHDAVPARLEADAHGLAHASEPVLDDVRLQLHRLGVDLTAAHEHDRGEGVVPDVPRAAEPRELGL